MHVSKYEPPSALTADCRHKFHMYVLQEWQDHLVAKTICCSGNCQSHTQRVQFSEYAKARQVISNLTLSIICALVGRSQGWWSMVYSCRNSSEMCFKHLNPTKYHRKGNLAGDQGKEVPKIKNVCMLAFCTQAFARGTGSRKRGCLGNHSMLW
jgi:hypothetical protein